MLPYVRDGALLCYHACILQFQLVNWWTGVGVVGVESRSSHPQSQNEIMCRGAYLPALNSYFVAVTFLTSVKQTLCDCCNTIPLYVTDPATPTVEEELNTCLMERFRLQTSFHWTINNLEMTACDRENTSSLLLPPARKAPFQAKLRSCYPNSWPI